MRFEMASLKEACKKRKKNKVDLLNENYDLRN